MLTPKFLTRPNSLNHILSLETGESLLLLPDEGEKTIRLKRGVLWLVGCSAIIMIVAFLNFNKHSELTMGILDKHPRLAERLIFEDNFDFFDEKKWTMEKNVAGGGNNEFQYYTDREANVFIKDGKLHLKPGLFIDLPPIQTIPGFFFDSQSVMTGDCEPFPACANLLVTDCSDDRFQGCNKTGNIPTGTIINPVTSGRVSTKQKFSFKYGRVEFHAKMPQGSWLWPALWLLSETDQIYGKWPASGEIDVCESRGNDPAYMIHGKRQGRNTMGSTLHFGDLAWWEHNGTETFIQADGWWHCHNESIITEGPDFSEAFYTYGLYWDSDAFYTYVVHPSGEEEILIDLRQGYKNGFWKEPLGYSPWPGWDPAKSPYAGHSINAPFDQEFYLIMNVAVGGNIGVGGYFQNDPWDVCEQTGECDTKKKFWEKRDEWYPTWLEAGENNALQVDWVRVWQ